jgi:putative salt-induced outer membrane protein YdiY
MHAIRHLLACTLLLCIAHTSHADQVILKNGDIISGKVISKSGNTLVFNTDYAGDMKINWNNVSTLSTDQPVVTLFEDDSYVKTGFLPAESGKVRVFRSEEIVAQENHLHPAHGLDDILYINPTPEQSGRGYKFTARANLALSQNRGNSVNQQGHMDGEMQMRAKAWRYTLGGEANQASTEQTTSTFNRRAYTSYDKFLNEKDFVYVQGSLEMDKFKDINLRSVIGGGYGYQVYETENTRLSVKGGLDLVSLDHYVAASEQFAALGWHIDFNHKLETWPLEVFHSQNGYRGFNSEGDILLKTRTGLRIPIKGGLSATAQVNQSWESNPAPGRKNSDTQIMFGLGYAYN